MRIHLNKYLQQNYSIIFLMLLAISVCNFFSIGVYMLIVVVVGYKILVNRGMFIPKSSVYITLFALFYLLFAMASGKDIMLGIKFLFLPLVWVCSFNLAKNKSIIAITNLIIALAFGMASHGLLNYVYNVLLGTAMITGRSFDFFTQSYSSATGQAINFTLFISISFWLIFIQKKIALRISGLVFTVASLLYSILLGSRSYFILILLSFGIALLCNLLLNSKYNRRNSVKIILHIVILVLIGVVIYKNDYFGVRTLYEDSYLFKRINIYDSMKNLGEDERFNRYSKYLRLMFEYPFGGTHIRIDEGIGYAHNLWLDIYDEAGVLALIALIAFSLSTLKHVISLCRSKFINSSEKVLLIEYIIIIFFQFSVEPVHLSAPLLVFSFVIIDGALTRCMYNQANECKEYSI